MAVIKVGEPTREEIPLADIGFHSVSLVRALEETAREVDQWELLAIHEYMQRISRAYSDFVRRHSTLLTATCADVDAEPPEESNNEED